jgi:DNA-directed RNA polymerase subunit RPC12/RpoP
MQLVFQCPTCDAANYVDVSDEQRNVRCSECDWHRDFAEADIEGDRPQRCLSCGSSDLWKQKDFPQGLGLMLVLIGATLSTIAWGYFEPLISLGILLVFAAFDLLLFVFMRDVLVCYRCRARHRKADLDEDHPRFNLEVAERYRQEEIRLKEMEQKQQPLPVTDHATEQSHD